MCLDSEPLSLNKNRMFNFDYLFMFSKGIEYDQTANKHLRKGFFGDYVTNKDPE